MRGHGDVTAIVARLIFHEFQGGKSDQYHHKAHYALAVNVQRLVGCQEARCNLEWRLTSQFREMIREEFQAHGRVTIAIHTCLSGK